MISPKQVQKVRELFQQGTPQTTIVKKENISRTKVAEIIKDYKKRNIDLDNKESIQEDVKSNPEILKLKEELVKEQLRRKIREQRQPFEVEKALNKIEEFKGEVYRYINRILNKALIGKELKFWKCPNCNDEGHVAINIQCTNCDYETQSGWFPEE